MARAKSPGRYILTYTVTGSGTFPDDMLRYDNAYPLSEEDVTVAFGDRARHGRRLPQRSVRIIQFVRTLKDRPTVGRWNSFGWGVTEINVARKKPTHEHVAAASALRDDLRARYEAMYAAEDAADNPELFPDLWWDPDLPGEVAHRTVAAVKRGGRRVKERVGRWVEERKRKQRKRQAGMTVKQLEAEIARREKQKQPARWQERGGVRVFLDSPSWLSDTSLMGELAKDSNPHGAWFRRIKKRLGEPSRPWGEPSWGDKAVKLSAEEWEGEDDYADEWRLEWEDGVRATLYFRRDDPSVPGGRWNIGASDKHAREALKRVRALFKRGSKAKTKAKRKNPKRGDALRAMMRGT